MIHDTIDLVLHPERYHGHSQRPPFFEGWYFKMVSPDRTSRFAVIPGIFLSDDPERHHAFVQVFDGVSGAVSYHRYPVAEFEAAKGRFDLRIGRNHFRLDGITLDIDDDLRTVRGEVGFGKAIPWTVTPREPGVMGWFGWMPFMECYHGILGFDHEVTGGLTVDGVAHDFSGGRGYIEKDWGKSFPGGWVWMQTNHFEQPEVSFTASIAIVPFLGRWFPGFLAGLWHEQRLYKFATYTGARTEKLDVGEHHVEWVLQDRTMRLEVFADRAEASILPGPNRADMSTRVPETLKAGISLRLTDRTPAGQGRVIFEGRGECAGLEVAGDLDKLIGAIR
ncbi:MAG: hypothetical protein IPK19_13490 [Chloroflexi bacterium]|nr:hypothetical protein [Chloroflexota bacterium]